MSFWTKQIEALMTLGGGAIDFSSIKDLTSVGLLAGQAEDEDYFMLIFYAVLLTKKNKMSIEAFDEAEEVVLDFLKNNKK